MADQKRRLPKKEEESGALTHYLGNDEYEEGNRVYEAPPAEHDGKIAEGNDLAENDDNDSDLPDLQEEGRA